MKSLAHPEWPYTGTPFEWRGFRLANVTVTAETEIPKAWPMYSPIENVEPVYQRLDFGPELT